MDVDHLIFIPLMDFAIENYCKGPVLFLGMIFKTLSWIENGADPDRNAPLRASWTRSEPLACAQEKPISLLYFDVEMMLQFYKLETVSVLGFVYGAKENKKLRVFIDDVNLPVMDKYGVQNCNEVRKLSCLLLF